MKLTTFTSRAALIEAATERLTSALRNAVTERGEAWAALSGGSTPEPIYRALAAMELDWRRITFALVDERFVPISSPASNEAIIKEALGPALSRGADFIPLIFKGETAEEAALIIDEHYAPLSFDIALMGMGEDGHTASWFPNARGLDIALDAHTVRSVIAINASQAQGSAERLTLTRNALKRARALVLVITGDAKRARLEQALAAQDDPVAALFGPDMPPIEVLWAP